MAVSQALLQVLRRLGTQLGLEPQAIGQSYQPVISQTIQPVFPLDMMVGTWRTVSELTTHAIAESGTATVYTVPARVRRLILWMDVRRNTGDNTWNRIEYRPGPPHPAAVIRISTKGTGQSAQLLMPGAGSGATGADVYPLPAHFWTYQGDRITVALDGAGSAQTNIAFTAVVFEQDIDGYPI